ncbi:MAG TPA: hypothetical protein PLP61_05915 [Nocardioides sp.]|uniref:hypothetical protein n=1 Tax=Nocardioides sp. TaxID=35761 RepID=UPI002D0E2A44|nr:hypothetical protein [Nocardioides sp.]HQR26559.1 hypothetical protein [Nocardioides sp.]
MSLRPLLLAPAAVLLLAGCGQQGSVTPLSETLPGCSEVWVDGGTLPADYRGCVGADDVLEVSEVRKCSSAEGSFVTFDRFFALAGGPISDAGTESATYQQLYQQCFRTGW